jgi:hypothetical protein
MQLKFSVEVEDLQTLQCLISKLMVCVLAHTLRYRSEFDQTPVRSSAWSFNPDIIDFIQGIVSEFNSICARFQTSVAFPSTKIKVVSIFQNVQNIGKKQGHYCKLSKNTPMPRTNSYNTSLAFFNLSMRKVSTQVGAL